MKRREALTAIPAGLVATSGCLGSGAACAPGEDEIASMPTDYAEPADGGSQFGETTYAIRGTVVKQLLRGVLVDDGSDRKVALQARYSNERIDHDVIDVGDCVEATAPLDPGATTHYRMPVMAVRGDDFSKVGEANDEVEEAMDVPHVNGGPVSYNPYADSSPVPEGTVGVRYRAGGTEEVAPRARNLFVLYDGTEAPWHELAADVAADQRVPDGSLATFPRPDDDGAGLLWKAPDRSWARRFGGVGFADRR